MQAQRLIVLKFGGSVLANVDALDDVVHEIARWRRDGWHVVAVVSAFAGRTAELLRATEHEHLTHDRYAVAAHLANGERESAAQLGLTLDRAGIPAAVLTPEACSLKAQGDPCDATPTSLDGDELLRHLRAHQVVVVPGFIANDEHRRTVVLGRGGSDLSALFIAHELNADRCRLIKDVDGLYEHDPASGGPAPRRYARARFKDALATDGSIVQHKAVRFAQSLGTTFELGQLNGTAPTLIGTDDRAFTESRQIGAPMRVALLGHGTVGAGVRLLLDKTSLPFDLRVIAVRTPASHSAIPRAQSRLTDNAIKAATSDVDVVIECIGDNDVARRAVIAALEDSKHVITANKALLAREGNQLRRLAHHHNVTIQAAASVGGALPVLEYAAANASTITNVRAVLNGTSNAVLDALAAGIPFEVAVQDAQQRGLAELDPTRDLSGQDAQDKLLVLADVLGWSPVAHETPALEHKTLQELQECRPHANAVLRQVATLAKDNASVTTRWIEPSDSLAGVRDEGNIVTFSHRDGSVESLLGRGAGQRATAEAVIGDLLLLARERQAACAAVERTTTPRQKIPA